LSDPVLLDTCAAIWLMSGERMTGASRAAIRGARKANLGVHVSAISAWEIGLLAAKGRITLTLSPQIWFETLLALPGVRLAPITPEIFLVSSVLPGNPPADPADRVLVATARTHRYVMITRDRKLLTYAEDGHIHVIPC
jgi:PIN domain nuclease of toxin-antitoxin system